MTLKEIQHGIRVLDSLRDTGIHTRMGVILLTIFEKEGLKQTEYAQKLNWKIQIINRYALNMEREGLIELIPVDSDPRGRARAIILKPEIRAKLAEIFDYKED